MKASRLVLRIGLVALSVSSLAVFAAWSQEPDKPPGADGGPVDFETLDAIFTLIEQDVEREPSRDPYEGQHTKLERVAKAYQLKAGGGDHIAQFKIGAMYLEDLSVREDCGKAFAWLSKAGGREHPLAQLAYGRYCLKCRDEDMRDDRLRAGTIEALGKLGPDAAVAVDLLEAELTNDWRTGGAAAVALGRMGARGVPALARALASNEVEVRRVAANGLAEAGAAARSTIPRLTELTKDDDQRVRYSAERALNHIRAKEEAK